MQFVAKTCFILMALSTSFVSKSASSPPKADVLTLRQVTKKLNPHRTAFNTASLSRVSEDLPSALSTLVLQNESSEIQM